mmetsp:Transcript_47204/g.85240  ORF Transcript_47204/g.85240 Transcript_47204/m.85240 type:complete len:282 (+) Transcript_47204:1338-2183(+)
MLRQRANISSSGAHSKPDFWAGRPSSRFRLHGGQKSGSTLGVSCFHFLRHNGLMHTWYFGTNGMSSKRSRQGSQTGLPSMEKRSVASSQSGGTNTASAQRLQLIPSLEVDGSRVGERTVGDLEVEECPAGERGPPDCATAKTGDVLTEAGLLCGEVLADRQMAFLISVSWLRSQTALVAKGEGSLLSTTGTRQSRPGGDSINVKAESPGAGAAAGAINIGLKAALLASNSPGDGVAGQSVAGTAKSTGGEASAAKTSPHFGAAGTTEAGDITAFTPSAMLI